MITIKCATESLHCFNEVQELTRLIKLVKDFSFQLKVCDYGVSFDVPPELALPVLQGCLKIEQAKLEALKQQALNEIDPAPKKPAPKKKGGKKKTERGNNA